MDNNKIRIAILGAGNLGTAIADGLVHSGQFSPDQVVLTRRRLHLLESMGKRGFIVESDNAKATADADVVIVAVEPQQVDQLLHEVRSSLVPTAHTLVSVVSGVPLSQIESVIGSNIQIVRAMPNTAVAVREAVTCIAANKVGGDALESVRRIFETVGVVHSVREEDMNAATALGACGIAFFLRAIRAASQGGIEIGFNAPQALAIAAQTAKGAATLLLSSGRHPEEEIDRVTTPRGCTIAGLNKMEHEGFSSAFICGITVAAKEASRLYGRESETRSMHNKPDAGDA